jgi:lipopolysaccharide biosynthesis glycosyltransferase
VYDEIIPVNRITNQSPANLYLMNRPDLVSTFTKVELWRQTQYKRIVYIDADAVCLRAPNELLALDTDFAAVPDIGWPDCFNSGVMVLNPDMGDYYSLLALAQRGISFDGADQGLLNMHFREWERLSFTYNCTPSGNYQYLPAYRHFQSSINIIHYIGKDKPWTLGRDNKLSSGVYGELLGRWWAVYDKHYRLPVRWKLRVMRTEQPLTGAQDSAYYSGQYQERSKTVQDYVKGEETMYLPGYSQRQPEAPPRINIEEPQEAPVVATEQPMDDQPETSKQVQQEATEPAPTIEQRKFSAPQVDWDPAR